jgi:hypothetical protein
MQTHLRLFARLAAGEVDDVDDRLRLCDEAALRVQHLTLDQSERGQ